MALNDNRYLAALIRMRDRISNGLKLEGVDSDTLGDKYTHCSWGMCSMDSAQWPHAADHTFPIDFIERGRVSTELQDYQTCPLQVNSECPGAKSWGCFYECRFFQKKGRKRRRLNREHILRLYNRRISKVQKIVEQAEISRLCACGGVGSLSQPSSDKVIPCPDCANSVK